ncbi:MAG: hypothetical protein P1P86_00575 [Bacteroidales bacterium]|nr:hypothetical protein [Bacteroidales bacterium]
MKNSVFIFALAFISAGVFGQKVNFSGEWKLNDQKSELGDQFSLAPLAMTVEHKKKTLDLTNISEWDGQEYESKTHYTLDGAECENIGFMESVTKSTAAFDKKAKTLTIVTKGSVEGMDYTLTQVMSMNEGSLLVESEAASDMGEMFETFVFDKKQP